MQECLSLLFLRNHIAFDKVFFNKKREKTLKTQKRDLHKNVYYIYEKRMLQTTSDDKAKTAFGLKYITT